ncbi:transporter substrate-binding domain-containing protein [Larsenimonas rhizosphaerae]|uniref:Transporter substrate-binding domain-containing protein n=1 Tax=Larsenimonas rhizosphaerae TaxID=2944682 RepID=A0AA41ZDU7_9GAMM|nr:transporter substrate-binding domain-containing protein [Larsenimonas rhizosphaerae]MCM2129941.1 transporter substrate-binding domain-containing protein [Larsenimonas rhizosphaerae]MCX2522640.1 transporter substrate-binding domain-containing protein [Larsenimonas rhizosphaerae]
MKRILTLSLMGAALVAGTAQAKDYDTVRIGVDIPYVPMEYRQPDGTLAGFDIDLGNALCEQAKLKCNWVIQGWDGIIPGLQARKFDAIMSSMTINDDRKKQILFSDPYMTPPSAWFTPEKSTLETPDKASLKGMNIGVQRGTVQDNYVTDMFGDEASIKRYATADDVAVDMEAGRLDIAFLDYPTGKAALVDSKDGKFKTVGDMLTEPKKYFGEGFGIAFRKRDRELADTFNKALAELKSNGTYNSLYSKYFPDGNTH